MPGSFHEGRAKHEGPAKIDNHSSPWKKGFLDKRGKVIIPCKFDEVKDFSQGLAAARSDKIWGFLDKQGRWKIPPSFDLAQSFSQGFAGVKIGGKAGFIDRKGKMVFGAFDEVGDFRENLAPVRVGEKWGFIDKTGKMVATLAVPDCEWLGPLAEGLALYRQAGKLAEGASARPEGKYGYVDAQGQPVIPARFGEADNFSQGLALVLLPGVRSDLKDGKYAFINRTGEVVIPLETKHQEKNILGLFQDRLHSYFSEGLAPMEKDRRFGFGDQTGKIVIPATFNIAGIFAEGLAPVGVGQKFGYIDKTGKFVWSIGDDTGGTVP
jgi:hypothetical protein